MRDLALELCYRAKASEMKGFQATSLETLRHMVASNAGITLLPRLACKTNDGVCYLSFTTPKPSRIIGLSWRKSCTKKILLGEIAVQIKKIIAKKTAIKVISTNMLCMKS